MPPGRAADPVPPVGAAVGGGWVEPGQTPGFDEYTVVLAGTRRVETQDGGFDVAAGQAVIAPKGEWVRYSTPLEGGA